MKLLIFPLIFLVTFGLMGMMGMSDIAIGSEYYDPTNPGGGSYTSGWYDSGGHMVAYQNWTLTNTTEAGTFNYVPAGGYPSTTVIKVYKNSTGSYQIYNSPNGQDLPETNSQFNLGNSMGVIALIAVVMAAATLVGLRVLGSGISDESVSAIIKGSALITVWLIFSSVALGMVTSIPYLGPVFYFFLTIVYTLGIINQVGHPGED